MTNGKLAFEVKVIGARPIYHLRQTILEADLVVAQWLGNRLANFGGALILCFLFEATAYIFCIKSRLYNAVILIIIYLDVTGALQALGVQAAMDVYFFAS